MIFFLDGFKGKGFVFFRTSIWQRLWFWSASWCWNLDTVVVVNLFKFLWMLRMQHCLVVVLFIVFVFMAGYGKKSLMIIENKWIKLCFLSTSLLAKRSLSNIRCITLTQFHITVSQRVWENHFFCVCVCITFQKSPHLVLRRKSHFRVKNIWIAECSLFHTG